MTPRATLRLQFHRGFTFADARALVPYFARLGVSHLYASPIATARAGSTHGYDVVDATTVNPELGGEAELRALRTALDREGMGLVLDIVPNHMAADPANAWWADVLRRGRASRYARYFDIDWEADDKVLLPILGKPLDEVLAAGELVRDGDVFRYFTHRLPAAEGGVEDQHWRLAWWRSAGDRINWRRFFDINELVCLRMEEPETFEAVHALPLRLHAEGIVDGLRIDHVDGLTDPAAYCRALRRRLKPGAWLVVEKILLRGEQLPADWGCDGTTGYDFMDEVDALQHDPAGAAPLAAGWARLSGRPADFAVEEEQARHEVVARSFGAQLDACARAFAGGELAPPALRRVLAGLLAHFPVYRTYGVDGILSAADRAVLARAAEGAQRDALAVDRWAVDALVARFEEPGRARAVARFQQLSAPVAAKAVEDTAFYRYGRLLSRNDVGFDVETFALDAGAFHARMRRRAETLPRAMLTTATHDHKRGEDVRARLAVLSGMATEWVGLQERWVAVARALAPGGAPFDGDIAMLLQTIVGAWPFDLERGDAAGRQAFAERLVAWQEKALREAKLASDWAAVDEGYETAARTLIGALVAEDRSPALLDEIVALVRRIAPPGALNGLTQALLRLTVPGIPDLYQGTELWDLSLVDPDNRRPVDWRRRSAGLSDAPFAELLGRWRDGRAKQALVARLLDLRRRLPSLFESGDYRPVTVEGAAAGEILAFCRRHGGAWLLVVVPHLADRLPLDGEALTLIPGGWRDTAIVLEDAPAQASCVLGKRTVALAGPLVPLADICGDLPFAVLSVS
ncbi:malto-oligosyltrehalose synthase [Reyranella sp.]|uniref:malto-oligosyltrehalose synthase n=1 Tax=Reyranella sp. TaxID=1929291 RepID=UPI003BABD68B